MKFRYLGRSGIQISALTFGNWLTQHSRSDVEAASRCIRAAIDAGVTSFDSAITGASRPEQIVDNVRAVDVDLPPEAVAAIDAVLKGVTVSDPGRTAEFTPASRPV